MRHFWRNGERGATTRGLEAVLGIRASSLYNAFGSKEGLLEQAVARYQELLERELLGPLADDPAGLAALDRFVARLADWLTAGGGRGCLLGRLMAERGELAPAVAARLEDHRTRLRAALAAALGRAAAAGEIPPDSVASRTELVLGMTLGLNMAVQAGLRGEEVHALAAGLRAEVGRWPDNWMAARRT